MNDKLKGKKILICGCLATHFFPFSSNHPKAPTWNSHWKETTLHALGSKIVTNMCRLFIHFLFSEVMR